MSEAGGLLGVLGVVVPVAKEVYNYLENTKVEKETKKKIYTSLQKEILDYERYNNELTSLIYDKFLPTLDNLNETYTKTQINSLLLINSNVIGTFSNMTNSEVNFVIACKDLTPLSGLMDDLKSVNKAIYDFMMLSKEITLNNKIIIDQRLYKYKLAYQDEILEKLDENELNKASIDALVYIHKIKNVLKPAINKSIIKRDIQQEYFKSVGNFIKANKRVKFDKSTSKDFANYIPEKLKPLVPIIEEIKHDIEEEQKRLREIQRKKKKLSKGRKF